MLVLQENSISRYSWNNSIAKWYLCERVITQSNAISWECYLSLSLARVVSQDNNFIYLFRSSEILLMHWLNNTACPRQPCETHHKNKVSSHFLETLARLDGRITFFSPSVLSRDTLGKLGLGFSLLSSAQTVRYWYYLSQFLGEYYLLCSQNNSLSKYHVDIILNMIKRGLFSKQTRCSIVVQPLQLQLSESFLQDGLRSLCSQ